MSRQCPRKKTMIEKKNVKKRLTDKNGCILIHDTEIDDSEYILISLYNCDTELEKLNILEELLSLLNNLELKAGEHINFSGGFNLYFNISLDAKDFSAMLKKCSLSKIIEIKELLDVCNICVKGNLKLNILVLGSNIILTMSNKYWTIFFLL